MRTTSPLAPPQADVFAAVPFVIRYSRLIDTIREVAAGEALQYVVFKFVGGMVDRYHEQRVEWMLHRATSGGGPLLNLGVHFLDLCRVLLPDAQAAGRRLGDVEQLLPPRHRGPRGRC